MTFQKGGSHTVLNRPPYAESPLDTMAKSTSHPLLILASASPRRKALLCQIGVEVDKVIPADINEDPIKGELPKAHALRLALSLIHI